MKLAARQVTTLSRTLDVCPEPAQLYAACCDEGRRPDTLLLQSADQSTRSGQKSMVITQSCLSMTCHARPEGGGEVLVAALSANGRGVLSWLREELAERVEPGEGDPDRFTVRYTRVGSGNEEQRLRAASVLDVVREAVLRLQAVGGDGPLPPLVAGSLGYDLLGVYESLPAPAADPTGWPDYELWLAEEVVLVDHDKRRTTVLRYVFGGPSAAACYHDASAALAARVAQCRALAEGPSPGEPSPAWSRGGRRPDCDLDDASFEDLVRKVKEHIVAGDVFQIVPSRTFTAPCPHPLDAYRRLRALNPSPYMFFVHGSRGVLFGASPESALTVRAAAAVKEVRISPIAGTRGRGRHPDGRIDADLDTRLEAELRLDRKEVAEHMMLVDLARNDVARVSEPGTRSVEHLLDVVRYSHVMHLVSVVVGRLRAGLDALHAYVATMNMGTLVGAPKLEAASLLRRYERTRRGAYGGAVGYLTARGELDTCIVIRSAVVRGGLAHVRAGCGVVFDSDPRAEADETRRKAAAVLAALQPSSAEETT